MWEDMGKGNGKTLTMEELRAAKEWIMDNPIKEPVYIKVSLWQAIKFKLKGFKVRLIK